MLCFDICRRHLRNVSYLWIFAIDRRTLGNVSHVGCCEFGFTVFVRHESSNNAERLAVWVWGVCFFLNVARQLSLKTWRMSRILAVGSLVL